MTRKGKLVAAILGMAALFAIVFFLWLLKFHPQAVYDLPFDCVWLKYTGYYCAGCGATRALQNVLNGHLYAAFRMNPFMMSVVPLGFLLLIWEGTRKIRKLPSIPLKPWMGWAFLIAVLLFTVLRNLPMAPFCYLAPTPIG